MKLSDGKAGHSYIVLCINLDDKIKRRLEILGMTECSSVDVLRRKNGGAMIIKVRGTRFAIGHSFAEGIMVGGEA